MAYCAIDSQSDEQSESQPSTAIQLDMQRHLVAELERIGVHDVTLTEYGAVLATVPATAEGKPVIGFCAHVDTAPQFHAAGVKPRLHKAWDGSAITFPDAPDLILDATAAPYLAGKEGEDIVTASGTTLLGADDKAGVAIIVTLAEYLLTTPGLAHGKIRLAFTPDEEIGRGVDPRLPADMDADFAYTLDGARKGEIEYESFSADAATVTIHGVSAHPGYAKDRLVNAAHLAARIVSALDVDGQTPETTDGRDGFIHCYGMEGGAATMTVRFILRDFELDGLEDKGARLRALCAETEAAHPGTRVTCDIRKQYRNMRYWLENDMTPVDLAREAVRAEGLTPVSVPIRGGTDGSRLTELGVPCPNIFTGMQDIHGPLEWISLQDMAAATRVCSRLVTAP
ncbi:peptidase T [Rhodobacteraceae bacterium ASV31]|nr:peptidase T [Anianabacter salinae]